MEEKIKDIQNIATDLLFRLDIPSTVTVAFEDNAYQVRVEVADDDKGVLIGYRGRSLQSLQVILGQLVAKKLGEWVRLIVHVGDYLEKRTQYLNELAQSVADEVMTMGTDVAIPDLSAHERRVVHMALTDHTDVVSESIGEGRDRKLVVKKRAA